MGSRLSSPYRRIGHEPRYRRKTLSKGGELREGKHTIKPFPKTVLEPIELLWSKTSISFWGFPVKMCFGWFCLLIVSGCIFFWNRDVFFVVSRWPRSPFLVSRSLFWYRDSALCCSTSRLSSSWDQSVFFGPWHPVKWRSKKISIPKRRYKISMPQKRHLDTN